MKTILKSSAAALAIILATACAATPPPAEPAELVEAEPADGVLCKSDLDSEP